jgi:GTPase KRas
LNYYLSLTDTAGQEEYRSLWAASNLQSDAFLLVYDITNTASLEGLSWFLDMIDIEAENRMEENARLLREKGSKVRGKREEGWKFPPIKIIAGNKCDLKDARVVSSKVGWEWAKSKNCGFMETSAREMVNIEETFACKSYSPLPLPRLIHSSSDRSQSRRGSKTTRCRRRLATPSNSLHFKRPYTHSQWCWSPYISDVRFDAPQPVTT